MENAEEFGQMLWTEKKSICYILIIFGQMLRFEPHQSNFIFKKTQ